MDRDTLLAGQSCNETFKSHTYARKFQLGAVIGPRGKHIFFYS